MSYHVRTWGINGFRNCGPCYLLLFLPFLAWWWRDVSYWWRTLKLPVKPTNRFQVTVISYFLTSLLPDSTASVQYRMTTRPRRQPLCPLWDASIQYSPCIFVPVCCMIVQSVCNAFDQSTTGAVPVHIERCYNTIFAVHICPTCWLKQIFYVNFSSFYFCLSQQP